MRVSQNKLNDMYGRALECVSVEFLDLPVRSEGERAAEGLREQYEIIIAQSASKSGLDGTAHQGTAERAVARRNIRDYMSRLARTGGIISRGKPGFGENFPAPSRMDDNELLAAVRAVAVKALEHQEDFIRRGLTIEFLASGAEFVTAFENAFGTTYQAVASRGAAVGGKAAAYDRADDYFDTLDDFIRNFYRDQPARLAAWKIASHIERTAKRGKKEVSGQQ